MNAHTIEQGAPSYCEMNSNRLPTWQKGGLSLADHFAHQDNPLLLFDGDGVVVCGDSLHKLQWSHPEIVSALRALEKSGVTLSPASARGDHFLRHLRAAGLEIFGPAILGGGQLCRVHDERLIFATPAQQTFFADLPAWFSRQEAYRAGFRLVQKEKEQGNTVYCRGDHQWQSPLRRTFWLIEDDAPDILYRNGIVAKEFFEQPARILAQKHGLDFDRDISLGVSRMHLPDGKVLVIVRFAPNHDGNKVTKAAAVEAFLPEYRGWVFIADGFGDVELARLTCERGGLVVSIGGNLDITPDAEKFAGLADIQLKSPAELVGALYYAALIRAWASAS